MALITKTYTFSSGAIIQADEHNTNLNTIYAEINGKLDNANIVAGAAIAESKVTFSASGHDHSGGTKGANVAMASLSISGQNKGDILYYTGTVWARLGSGSAGQTLTMASGVPTWA